MIQGLKNARVWKAVIVETTGRIGATVSEADGAIVNLGRARRAMSGKAGPRWIFA
jgi:hypothetical protein